MFYLLNRINRIRLEFKDYIARIYYHRHIVLIESDWNLKSKTIPLCTFSRYVLIESDWNLKLSQFYMNMNRSVVLIESDWNLKSLDETAVIEPERY